MRRGVLGLLALLALLGQVPAAEVKSSLEYLRSGDQWAAEGRFPQAWRDWQMAFDTARTSYLLAESQVRIAATSTEASKERATALGRLLTYAQALPPRWLSDDGRKLLAEAVTQRVDSGLYADQMPDPGVTKMPFAGTTSGLGFQGTRYFWMTQVPSIPPPVDQYLDNGEPIQRDPEDRLPELRLPAGREAWSVVEPRHAGKDTTDEDKQRWRFDRCLLGYTYEAITQYETPMGQMVWFPTEPWHDKQPAVWQLRFRVFYPSPALGHGDYRPLAVNLLDALLRAQRLGAEYLGRDAWGREWGDRQVIDVWVTPNASDDAIHAGGERWLNNLYFYKADTERAPAEWVREAFHEYGHLMMPRIGRYTATQQFETWLDGPLGERLLLAALDDLLRATREADLSEWMKLLRRTDFFKLYHRQEWDPVAKVFADGGPDSTIRQLRDDRGAAWLLGFGCWVHDAHDAKFNYDYWRPMAPNAQYTADSLLVSYEARMKDAQWFWLRCDNPLRVTSDTQPRRLPGAVEVSELTEVEYAVYLPADQWKLRLITTRPGAVTLTLDGATPQLLETSPDIRTAPAFEFSSEGGWHRLRIRGFGQQPVGLVRALVALARLKR